MKKIILTLVVFCFLFFDAMGQEIEWQKNFGGSSADYAYCIQQTNDGGYIMAGASGSNDGDVTGNHGASDCWVVKLDRAGNIQWQKCLGGSNTEYANSIQQTNDGGYVVAGYTYSNDGDVTGNNGSMDYWVVKLDSAGNIQWQKCLGALGVDQAHSIQQTSDEGYVVAGVGWCAGYWVIKLDASGNIQWQKCYGGWSDDQAYSIQQTTDGGYVLAGRSNSNDGDVTGNHGDFDYWVVKLDNTGNIQWQKCLGGTNNDQASSIQQTADGGYVVAGFSTSNDGDVTGNHGSWDYWVVKLDGAGNIQWQKCLGGSSGDNANSIQQTADWGFVVAGFSHSDDGDVTGNHGNGDFWVVKLDMMGNIQWQKCLGGTSIEDGARSIRQTVDGGYVITGNAGSIDGDLTSNHGNRDCWVVKLAENFNTITGKLFFDINSNGSQDNGEPALLNKRITELNTGGFAFSQNAGIYYLNVPASGNFSVVSNLNYFTTNPSAHNVFFSGIHQTDSINDFAFTPIGSINDLCITITPMGNFRANMNANYMISYENVGTTTLNGTVIFFPDNDVTFVSSNPTATSVTTDSMVWNVGTLMPFQTGSISVTVHVNATTPNGTLINSNTRIEPVAGDNYQGCNYAYWEVYTTGSYDPNAIIVDRDTILTTELSSPSYLNYIIYFQNTGNDTAFNVKVLNHIDNFKFQLNTFEFITSSHPVGILYKPVEKNIEFKFDKILLPDSNVNEPESHGLVCYRIKPLTTLVAGDVINSTASIYFDFNAPVQTNTSLTKIALPPEEAEEAELNTEWAIYPNPSTKFITVYCKNLQQITDNIQLIVFDLLGKEIFQSTINFKASGKSILEIDVSSFSQGVYILELQTGEKVLRGKFVKE